MYFWDIHSLKRDIISGGLSEKGRFLYFFIGIILLRELVDLVDLFINSYFISDFSDQDNESSNWFGSMINGTLLSLIICLGTYYSYRVNSLNDGNDFLGRFVSISFVVGIRFLVLLVIFLLAILILGAFLENTLINPEVITSYIFNILPLSLVSFMYIRIVKHIKDVSVENV
ncbi:hypothetical protein M9194_06040 [Vibrio sp. S4M6]|uniref:hypothetical protein n=1 Tax=Vibrio sinus TaxID=2946865 RepID=UPI00202A3877|nr:hypothetical protein [Vibrio sinus]MCL9780991.1 hypothetical protein [Vibrio sinus]